MHRFLRHIALFLLLLFCRVMVPDTLLLELHSHTHTVHADHTDTHEAQIGQKHKHCPVEDLFGAPFQAPTAPVDLIPVVHSAAYAKHYNSIWHGATVYNTSLRGPPVA